MKLLTLTPDVETYAVAGIAVYALACGPLAEYLHSSWPRARRPRFLLVYVGVMAAIAAVALVVLELPSVTGGSPVALSLAFPVGMTIGFLAIRWDALVRRTARARARRDARKRAVRVESRPAAAAPGGEQPGSVSTLALLLAVAILEEVLFRGVLVDLALSLSSPAAVACVAGTLAAFALSHVYWGWSEVASKGMLGALALVSVLALGTVVPAVVAHAVLNTYSWRAVRADVAVPRA
jgi:membrane protease YdiL (CAAX protease family)